MNVIIFEDLINYGELNKSLKQNKTAIKICNAQNKRSGLRSIERGMRALDAQR